MNRLITLTIAAALAMLELSAQEPGITVYPHTRAGGPNARSLYVHNNLLYFAMTDPVWKDHEVWIMDGTEPKKRYTGYAKLILPSFEILGGKGDSLFMLAKGSVSYKYFEGFYAFNLKDGLLYPIVEHNVNNNLASSLVLRDGHNIFYNNIIGSDRYIYRYNYNTRIREIFCQYPVNTNVQVVGAGNKYYVLLSDKIYPYNETAKQLGPALPVQHYSGVIGFYGGLYFGGYDSQSGGELYKYNGTGQPVRVTDLNPGNMTSIEQGKGFVIHNWRIYFWATNGYQMGLYEYNPATKATRLCYMPSGNNPIDILWHCSLNNRLYFGTTGFSTPVNRSCHYVYNGIDPPQIVSKAMPSLHTVYNGELYYVANGFLHRFSDAHLGPAPTNVFDATAPATVNAYPNPVVNDAVLELNLNQAQIITIQLTDINGRMLHAQQQKQYATGKHTITLPMQGISTGIYVYRLSDGNGNLLCSGRLIKQ